VVALPENHEGAMQMKIEKYLLLVLAVAVLLMIGSLFYH
jgi:cell division protein FtsL